MKKHALHIVLVTAFASYLPSVFAAPVNYEMNLRTYSGLGAGGATGMMSAMFGGKGSISKQMDLRLANPADIPGGYSVEHLVPEGMRIGPSLPLKGERRGTGSGGDSSEAEQPEGKVLIYWGCSETVLKGQPEVIDLKAMGSRVSPEVAAMAQQSRKRKGGGDAGETLPPRTLWWPYGDNAFTGIPAEASVVGEHVVKASFMQQEIRYALDKDMDFLEALNFKSSSSDLQAAIPLKWDQLSRAKGYNLNAVGAGDKEVIIWMAARNKNPMLPGSQNSCTIPAGIFQKTSGAMAMAEAVGPTKGFAYPPLKPGEKKPLIWTAKVRVNGFDNLMLGMGDVAKDAASDAAADSVVPGGGSVIKSLKGLFGN